MPERTSTAGVARDENRYLLAKRKPGGDLGGKWEFPGGKVRYGESPEAGLKREWMEEFSVEITIKERISESRFSHKETDFRLLAYRVEPLSRDFSLLEHTETGWFTLKEMETLDIADSDRVIVGVLKD